MTKVKVLAFGCSDLRSDLRPLCHNQGGRERAHDDQLSGKNTVNNVQEGISENALPLSPIIRDRTANKF